MEWDRSVGVSMGGSVVGVSMGGSVVGVRWECGRVWE